MHKYLQEMWRKPKTALGEAYKQRMASWRGQPTLTRVVHPTRPDRARRLGYKAKQGFAVVRVRVKKGSRKTPKHAGGRRPARAGRFFTLNKSKQQVAEEKAARRYSNMEVLNSYWAGEDGSCEWFEVILVDRVHPSVAADKTAGFATLSKSRGRVFRGLTASGRRARGLKNRAKTN